MQRSQRCVVIVTRSRRQLPLWSLNICLLQDVHVYACLSLCLSISHSLSSEDDASNGTWKFSALSPLFIPQARQHNSSSKGFLSAETWACFWCHICWTNLNQVMVREECHFVYKLKDQVLITNEAVKPRMQAKISRLTRTRTLMENTFDSGRSECIRERERRKGEEGPFIT